MKIDNTKILIFSIKLIIAIIIGSVVIYNIDAIELRYIVKNADVSYIIFAVSLLPLNLYFQFLKWKYLVDKTADERVPTRQLWVSVFWGISFGFITPGRIGELGKLFAIKNGDKFKLLSISLIEKIYDTFPVIIFGAVSIPFLPHLFFTNSSVMRTNLILFALIISIMTYFTAVHPGLFRMLLNYFKNNILKNNIKFNRFCEGLRGFKKHNARVLLFLSSVLFIIYTAQFVLLILAFGDIDIFHAFFGVWSAILLKTFLPVSLGDIGVREGTAAYIFNLMDFPASASVSAAFLLFVINILLPASVGVFMIPFTSKHNR
ncbi:MAG: flippase-like domain-containing protein [Candidatus Delongbacteria bacterium]|nr:flippase-like domain-containing protein [Candidatus Delongbacteria bacterium]MCG2759834.1 flippase-like domain-containing protein [Candidatus Delongbacteria bacterium]